MAETSFLIFFFCGKQGETYLDINNISKRDYWLTCNLCYKVTQTCAGCKDNSGVMEENWKYEPYVSPAVFSVLIHVNYFLSTTTYTGIWNELFLCGISYALGSFSSSSLFLTHVFFFLILNGVMILMSSCNSLCMYSAAGVTCKIKAEHLHGINTDVLYQTLPPLLILFICIWCWV